jgi:hypothetical protein
MELSELRRPLRTSPGRACFQKLPATGTYEVQRRFGGLNPLWAVEADFSGTPFRIGKRVFDSVRLRLVRPGEQRLFGIHQDLSRAHGRGDPERGLMPFGEDPLQKDRFT